MSHELQGDTARSRGSTKPGCTRIHTQTIWPPVKHRPKMSLTLQIPESLIRSLANSPQRGCLWGHSAVPQMEGWTRTCGGSVHGKALQRPIKIWFWCHPQEEIADDTRPSQTPAVWIWRLQDHLFGWRREKILNGTRRPPGLTAIISTEPNFNVFKRLLSLNEAFGEIWLVFCRI